MRRNQKVFDTYICVSGPTGSVCGHSNANHVCNNSMCQLVVYISGIVDECSSLTLQYHWSFEFLRFQTLRIFVHICELLRVLAPLSDSFPIDPLTTVQSSIPAIIWKSQTDNVKWTHHFMKTRWSAGPCTTSSSPLHPINLSHARVQNRPNRYIRTSWIATYNKKILGKSEFFARMQLVCLFSFEST